MEAPSATEKNARTTPGHQKQWKRRGRMYQRGTVAVETKGGCEGYGDMPSVAEGSCGGGKWENGLNARMGYSGDSGGGDGDFFARIFVYKGEEGRLSETGWIIVE
eukprot:scaffold51211_cov57-Attheya_sp.AAC.3